MKSNTDDRVEGSFIMEDDFYQMYLEEVALVEPCTIEEEQQLISTLLMEKQESVQRGTASKNLAGEAAAKRLVEGNLKLVLDIVKELVEDGCSLPVSDCVQEANIALIMAVNEYTADCGSFPEFIISRMKDAVRAAMEEQNLEEKMEEEVLARVNVLKEISKQMAEELGREATVEEMAAKMKMTTEEIKDIMKLTLDAMSVNEDIIENEQ